MISKKTKVCIVVSTYNPDITIKALKKAQNYLQKKGKIKVDIFKVPGSFEIPVSIFRLIRKYDGFVAIGCIIKGKTNNFDLISSAITNGIMDLSVNFGKPIGNSIITVFNKNQAKQRIEKGLEAATAVLQVLKNGP